MANIIEHRKFICVCFGDTNNNKAWQITLYDNDDVLVEWGRVGKALQNKLHSSVGRRKFKRLINDKTSKSNSPDKLYTEVKAIDSSDSTVSKSSSIKNGDLKEIAKKQIKYNSPILANFIEWLTEVNAHNILVATGGSVQYNVDSGQFKTPMGIIVPDQVKEARNIL
ncbi:MAG: WGR domain-containing protein [Clostridia bacterium]|jgi:predicted DNA-binding WGR domain protein